MTPVNDFVNSGAQSIIDLLDKVHQLEIENGELHKLVAELEHEIQMMQWDNEDRYP